VVLEPGEALFLHGGSNHPVLEKTGAGIVAIMDAEDSHGP
jgi:hypothetical protein